MRSSRPAGRILVAAVLSVAMVGPLLAMAARPAAAAHQYLWWNEDGASFRTFGPNAPITIYQGALERSCDFVNTAADVYIVPEGVSAGPLTDVSGAPNTIITGASGGLFIEETIGITQPSGTVPPGRYAVVYDECQDGKFDPGEDFVQDPAFEYVLRGNPPDINPRIAQLKGDAGQEAAFWAALLLTVETLETLQELNAAVECLAGGLAGCALSQLSDYLKSRIEDAVKEDLGLTDPVDGAKQEVGNLVKMYAGIKADPPDPNFRQPGSLAPVATLEPDLADPIHSTTVAVGSSAATESRLAEALLHAIERYQGADAAGDVTWALVHAAEAKAYTGALADQLAVTDTALDRLAQAVAADTTDHDGLAAFAEPNRARMATSGFDAAETQALADLGLDAAEITSLQAYIAGLDHAGYAEGRLLDEIADLRGLNAFVTPHLRTLQRDLDDMIAFMQADPALLTKAPVADAGGPYAGAEGAGIALDASASSDADSPIAGYAWDLDRDGAFDDATGATPTFTPPAAFTGMVAVRVTDSTGLASTDVAHVAVSEANRPPTVTVDPDGPHEEVTVGRPATFTAAAADPDGDPVTVRWLVDGVQAATGPSFAYAPTVADVGPHTLWVEASDGRPDGGSTRAEVGVAVLQPDADGDGWRANTDCDDGNAEVNPGHVEVVGNGIDDDCDPATTDAGSAPQARFTMAPSPAVVTEAVTFTDASTDADGGVVAWAWDFGDGATATVRHPSHVYAAPGTYTVSLTVTDEQGDTATTTQSLRVGAPPVPSFTVTPDAPVAGEEARFTDASTDPDGKIASRRWDFGDGTTSTEPQPGHTYGAPGAYTVTLAVTDDTGLTREVSRQISVRGRPTADFAAGGGMNVARLSDGAAVVSASSVASTSASHLPENAVDDSASTSWLTASGQNRDQQLTVALVPGGPHVIERVVLAGTGSTNGLQDFELRVSTTGTQPADFTTVVAGTVPRDANPHSFTFPAVDAAYVQLVAKTNWGNPQLAVRQLQVWERPREGGVVSLQDGPRATVVAASSGTAPADAIDGNPSTSWSTASGARTNQSLTVDLGGDRSYTIDRVGLTSPASTGPRNFEIRVSDTTSDAAAFTTVFTGTAANTTSPQQFAFAATPARFVQLLVRDNHGSTCCIRVNTFTVLTPEGANAARGDGVGAFVVGTSSSNTLPPENAIDLSTSTAWQTGGAGANVNQHLDVLLVPGGPHRIDRARLVSSGNTFSLRRFEIAVSTTTRDPGAFKTVASGALPRDGLEHWVKFAPVDATFVRLRMLDNHGGSVIQLNDFRVYATSQGGPTLAFDDRSSDPEDALATWSWDFGDGTTSTERHPVHVYASPGAYTVTLTVTDADGLQATATHTYNVLATPAADFTWAPVEPLEGQTTTFTDASSDPDGSIVGWRWRFPHTTERTTRSTSTSFPDNGSWDVTLDITDSQLLSNTVTRTVTVRNAPPTAGLGSDVSRLWGEGWAPPISANDPGATDRPTLQCVLDYGDGSQVQGPCSQANVRAAHAYADPGTYTATLTVTDKDGASDTDSAVVTVKPHDTFTNVYAVPGSAAGGQVDVVARLWDRVDFDAPVSGRPLTLTLGSESVTLTTDAGGAVAARLALPAGGGSLTASFAGDLHLRPSSDTDAVETGPARPPGDIVFIVDESGSMGDDQEAVRRNIATIANRLGASVDFQMGVVGFGAGQPHQDEPTANGHIHLPVTDDVPAITAAVNELTIDGGFEPGYHGITAAMSDAMGYRANAGLCAVIIADESASQGSTTQAQARAALSARNAVLFGIVDLAAGRGYKELAEQSGGQAFDIVAFRTNPEPVLAALTDTCVAEIVQRPDLVVAVDDGTDTASPGQTLTYAITVTNASQRPATGVVVSAPLPPEVSFTGAGDGGAVAGDKVTWPAFDLAAGATATRSLTVSVRRPLPPGTTAIAVSATATDDGSGGPDITPTNNTATDTDTVEVLSEPVAEDQSVTTDEDTPVAVTLQAEDPAGAPLTYTVVDAPQHGTLTGAAPDLLYTPAPDYSGPDRFTFSATAGDRSSNVATVSMTVVPVNDPPVVRLDPAGPIDEGGAAVEVRSVASDVDGDALTYTWSADTGTLEPQGATASYRSDDGPASATVRVTVSDGRLQTDATTVVEVRNVAPTVDAGPDKSSHWGLPVPLAGTITDPSGADRAAGLNPVWDFGDGSLMHANPVEHAYADPGQYTATLTATDKDGGVGSDSASLTVTKRPTTLAYTGSSSAGFGWTVLSAQVGDAVDSPTARLAGREVRFEVGGQVFTATTGADGMATVAGPVLLPPGTHQVTVRAPESSHYLEAVAPVTVVVANSPGKVTGGALRAPAGGSAGFVVQSDGTTVKGELQYSGGPRGAKFHASELTALGVSPDGKAAWFAGVGRDGRPFVAYVEDQGEPGTSDVFRLRIGEADQTGDGRLEGGNIQIHPAKP